jgi:Zn-dependent oligopeptidase
MNKSGIHIKPQNKGKFTAKAKRAGMSVQAYASKVLKPSSGVSAATKKQAQFAKNSKKFKH